MVFLLQFMLAGRWLTQGRGQPMDFLLQFIASGRWLTPGSGSANGFPTAIYCFWALAQPRFGLSQWIFDCKLWLLGVG